MIIIRLQRPATIIRSAAFQRTVVVIVYSIIAYPQNRWVIEGVEVRAAFSSIYGMNV